MSLDAHLTLPSALEAASRPALWTWLAPKARVTVAPTVHEGELGYESALPWTLGQAADEDGAPLNY